ncbi:MAG: lysylphosphatidylglycerol synthase transmembrane domain-containing protein [Myxococcota bacterium]
MSAPAPPRRFIDWRILPPLAVTAVVLWLLVDRVAGAGALLETVRGARWSLLPWAFAFAAANLGIGCWRWALIVRAMGHALPYGRFLWAVLATWPLALLTPARAGDVLRALAIGDRVPPWEGAGSVVAEKAIDVQSLCVLAMAGTLLHGRPAWAAVAGGLLAAEWAFLYVLLRHQELLLSRTPLRRFAGKLRALLRAFRALLSDRPRAVLAIGSSLVSWGLAAAIVQTFLHATGAPVPFHTTVGLWPIAVVAGMLPVTVAGLGTRDAAFVLALRAATDAAVPEGAVLASTLGYALVGTWLWALVGLPFGIRWALRLGAADRRDPDHG